MRFTRPAPGRGGVAPWGDGGDVVDLVVDDRYAIGYVDPIIDSYLRGPSSASTSSTASPPRTRKGEAEYTIHRAARRPPWRQRRGHLVRHGVPNDGLTATLARHRERRRRAGHGRLARLATCKKVEQKRTLCTWSAPAPTHGPLAPTA